MTGSVNMMTMVRLLVAAVGLGAASLVIAGCGSHANETPPPDHHVNRDSPDLGSQRGSPPGPPHLQNGHWDDNGRPVNGGPKGADGSTGNDLTQEYCAQNEDPGCPADSYVGPNAIRSPDGSNNYVPCEGTICTNPNHGAGDDPNSREPGDDGN
jgi:hypothetical protein